MVFFKCEVLYVKMYQCFNVTYTDAIFIFYEICICLDLFYSLTWKNKYYMYIIQSMINFLHLTGGW